MSTAERWLVIDRWDDFQHPDVLRSGVPPWIKDYTRQLSDDEYLSLSFHQRGILHSLRIEYARARRQLLGSTSALSRRLGQRVTTRDLEALNHAGFIHFSASKPASSLQAPLQAQSRREKNPLTPFGDASNGKSKTHVCPHDGLTFKHDWQLDEHLASVHEVQLVTVPDDDIPF